MKRKINLKTLFLHFALCAIVLCSPIILMVRDQEVNIGNMYLQLQMPICMLAVFYVNYLWLVPKLFLRNDKLKFGLCNLLIGGLICTALEMGNMTYFEHLHQQFIEQMADDGSTQEQQNERHNDHRGRRPPRHMGPPIWFFAMRNMMTLLISIGVATMIRTNMAFNRAEAARKEAELGRADAELKNLRNQINPHFLLNTLNNIYALIQFDNEKAQTAVLDLSRLLRFALYDNQQDYVALAKEIEFEERYVNLMRIRVPKSADITFLHQTEEYAEMQIMPLIYISLIENAFKHGIKADANDSFIHINMQVKNDSIIQFVIENSNYPKDDKDRSGSGIGLEQVQKRLDMSYPNRYKWTKSIDEKSNTYRSELLIETNPNNQLI
ncbi:MAG: histidine kinase [Bacteroidaceae bacterium]|nr:histidine kinase [Bacteroidaceae bacterium]